MIHDPNKLGKQKAGPKSKAEKGKEAAKADMKQRTLTFGLSCSGSSSSLPTALPAPKPKPKLSRPYKPRPANRPQGPDAATLEANAFVHDLIDSVIHNHESQVEVPQKNDLSVVDIEVRSIVNDMINCVIVKASEDHFYDLKPKRAVYSAASKRKMVDLVDKAAAGSTATAAVKSLNKVQGFENVTTKMIRDWKTAKVPKKRGPKQNLEFEEQVLAQLIFTQMEKVEDVERAVVVANVTHSFGVVQLAAKMVQKMPYFADNEKVQKLTFSKHWCGNFLKRSALRRRRITAQDKVRPSVEEVRATMAAIQKMIAEGGYDDDEVVNSDETGCFFGAPPKSQWVPKSAQRATSTPSDEKARFTSLLTGKVSGKMHPSFNIVKMSVKGVDLTSSTTLRLMMEKQPGFSAADGWELKIWKRRLTLPMKGKKEPVTSDHARPYLIRTDGTIVTVQARAWMDSAGLCMWADVQLGPIYAKKRGKCLVVWDNCGFQATQANTGSGAVDTLQSAQELACYAGV
uniref:HTH CENPB-type domain-containing protein n=1 Tax=Coccolithus braarudii TaxID=221442 RepID=A0A7S0Q0W4_9EUKA|mmetsp:Transcript_22108/g.47700  ORF Transcript_22108/g.47700 Transcript_22108/m.47700 type:complete len:514 (+) Transcript_22108:119-1660(+)